MYKETLDLLVEDVDRCFSTKRKTPTGKTEIVETSFDHALFVLKLFELTGEVTYLQNWIDYVFVNSVFDEGGVRWNFSPKVTDIPPDADSTAMNLLYFTIAEQEGAVLPQDYSAVNNLAQFRGLANESGGIETFFGRAGDVDPIVNTTVAFLYILNQFSDETTENMRMYLRKQTKQLTIHSKPSKYYEGGAYFAERIAKLSHYDPEILDDKAEEALKRFLRGSRPKNSLETALLSIGASYQGLHDRAIKLNGELVQTRKSNGLWPFGTFYTQRTPFFRYGNEKLTTLFAFEALKAEEEDFQIKKVSLTRGENQ